MTTEEDKEFKKTAHKYRWLGSFWIVLIGATLILCIFFAGFIAAKSESLAENSFPQSQVVSEGKHYAVSFDLGTKNPSWVMEVLTNNNPKAKTEAKKQHNDANIREELLPSAEDYQGSGFDPVSLLIFAQLRHPLSASSPQSPALAKYWAHFNDYVRDLPQKLNVDRVLVITEPLYLPQETSKTVVYDVIGEDNIAVPTHFFRVIFYSSRPQASVSEIEKYNAFSIPSPVVPIPPRPFPPLTKLYGEAFLIPNQAIKEGTDLDSFKVQSWEEVEKIPGVVLPDNLTFFTESWE